MHELVAADWLADDEMIARQPHLKTLCQILHPLLLNRLQEADYGHAIGRMILICAA